MKKTLAATAAVIALGAAIPLAAGASGYWQDEGPGGYHGGHHGGAGMMGHHGDMEQHHDRMGRHEWDRGDDGRGRALRARIRMQEFLDTYDADHDGRVTQDEVDQWRENRLRQFDANGDGQLSLDEYEQLWLDAMHERMVRQFQQHDADGNGEVTPDEFGKRTAHIVIMRDRNDDGAISMDDLGGHRAAGPRPRGGRQTPEDGSEPQPTQPGAPQGEAPMLPNTQTSTEQQ